LIVVCKDNSQKRLRALEQTLGYTEREALARLYLDFVIPRSGARQRYGALLEGETTLALERGMLCKDGRTGGVE